jgi:hypothetical protein
MDFVLRRALDQVDDLPDDDCSGDPNWVSKQPGIRRLRFACAELLILKPVSVLYGGAPVVHDSDINRKSPGRGRPSRCHTEMLELPVIKGGRLPC